MYMNKQQVIDGLKARYDRGDSLKYTPISRNETELYNACKRLFGDYKNAVNAAGFEYDKITGKRTWDANKVITEIQRINSEGSQLNPSYINKKHGALYRQACNYFGSWKDAVAVSLGVNYDDIIKITKWTPDLIINKIQERVKSGKSLTTISLIKESEKHLLDAGTRYFGDWASAVNAAGYNYDEYLIEGNKSRSDLCTKNTEEDIKNFIISRFEQGLPLNSGHINSEYRTYMHSACYRFGSWRKAVETCGIDYLDVAVDTKTAIRAGHMFEELVGDVLNELSVEFTKESDCKWRPDFIINNDYWMDAKLSTWTKSIPETIEKYEPHVERLSIIYFRGEREAKNVKKLTEKTDMFHIDVLLKKVKSDRARSKFYKRCEEIDAILT